MYCTNCGQEYLSDFGSCPYCGYSSESVSVQNNMEQVDTSKERTIYICGLLSFVLPVAGTIAIVLAIIMFVQNGRLTKKAKTGLISGICGGVFWFFLTALLERIILM